MRIDAFEAATVLAIGIANLPDVYADEFLSRLDARTVPLVCLAMVLLESPAAGGWEDLRQAAIGDLVDHPCDAVQILNLAVTRMDWPRVSVATASDGSPHAPIWTATLTATHPEPRVVTTVARSAKLAHQRGALALLAAIAEVRAPSFEDPAMRAFADAMNGPAGDAVAARFIADNAGTPAGDFAARFESAGQREVAVAGARAVVDAITGATAPVARRSNADASVPAPRVVDPVAALYEAAAKASPKLRQPRWGYDEVIGGFAATCTFASRSTQRTGATKKAAKKAAAAAMLALVEAT